MSLKPFRTIPKDIVEWTKWIREQDFQFVINDNIVKGTAMFGGVAEEVVEVDEADDDYTVLIDSAINETFWVTNKKTTSFTINSSESASTADVKWVLIR